MSKIIEAICENCKKSFQYASKNHKGRFCTSLCFRMKNKKTIIPVKPEQSSKEEKAKRDQLNKLLDQCVALCDKSLSGLDSADKNESALKTIETHVMPHIADIEKQLVEIEKLVPKPPPVPDPEPVIKKVVFEKTWWEVFVEKIKALFGRE